MATIVTVHGTFSSGPESGENWWQKGGPLENELRSLVEGEDGRLDFIPHVWDGLNSENSRRAAGKSLLGRLMHLEDGGERYCLIGHSHGGSVVLGSLLHSTYRRRQLSKLSRWITVGTPFIAFARRPLLFLRLGLLGKAAFIALFTWTAVATFELYREFTTGLGSLHSTFAVAMTAWTPLLLFYVIAGWFTDRLTINSEAVLPKSVKVPNILLSALIILIFMVIGFTATNPYWFYSKALKKFIPIAIAFFSVSVLLAWIFRVLNRWSEKRHKASSAWSSRWLSLRHPQDEAIEGLSILPRISFPIFGKEFAVAPLTVTSILAFPLLIMLAMLSSTLFDWLKWLEITAGLPSEGNDSIFNVMTFLPFVLPSFLGFFESQLAWIIWPFLGTAMFFLVAIILVSLSKFVATVASRLLSGVLDRLTWAQIRASAYGNDTLTENARSASDSPSSIEPQPPLPQSLAAEISKLADSAVAASASKFRASFNRLAFAEDKRTRSDLIADYLTWDELIHTAYFKVPLFNKLLAYSIAHSEGFRPTERFLADPDYSRVATLHAELIATAEQSKSA
jgi:hypothetical protein